VWAGLRLQSRISGETYRGLLRKVLAAIAVALVAQVAWAMIRAR